MEKISHFECMNCQKTYPADFRHFTCPDCGLDGILDVHYHYNKIKEKIQREDLQDKKSPNSHWRYRFLMPLSEEDKIPTLRVGMSPLYRFQDTAKEYGVKELIIKDDGVNPTSSLKDRASSVGVSLAVKEGKKAITCASTGNAASSLAGNSASIGIKPYIFVPGRAPEAKIAQCLIFGAEVFVVNGSYEDAFQLSMECAEKFGFYNRNSGINPFMVEGKKTVSMEICEQLSWDIPDYLIMSVGDGCSIAGGYKGFYELYQLGWIDRIPKVIGVQAEGASPIHKAWKNKADLIPEAPKTLADSIAVGTPRNWRKAMRAIEDSNGCFTTVNDEEILEAIRTMGRKFGICGEPAGVTAFAGFVKLNEQNFFKESDRIAMVVSGNGLKDIQSVIHAAGGYQRIDPDIKEVEKRIKS